MISGLGWSTAGRFAALPAGAAVNVLIARLLPPTDVGAYFVIVNLVGILAVVSMLGLNQAVVRGVSEAMTRGRPAAAGAVVRDLAPDHCGRLHRSRDRVPPRGPDDRP